jgi:drug/metabolite transporter (DMT)-like permease
MSLESVFAVAAGYLFLNEMLSSREALGSIIIFLAVILSQIPLGRRKELL